MKIAIYKDVQYNFESICKDSMEGAKGYVRISEFVDVEFPPLSDAETIQKQLHALDSVRAEVSRKFADALKEIDDAKAKLQALTYEVTP